MLTITIPTFNRNKILRKNLIKLLPQLTDKCRLIIIDNSSPTPVQIDIEELLITFPRTDIRIIRNKHNVGLTGNIIKCFEQCEDGWLWILGDDDEVKDDAVSTILHDIECNNQKTFLSYAWDKPSLNRSENLITQGVDELIDSMESLGVILFISTSIYNVNKTAKNITYGSFFQSTYAPHLAILFMSLKNGGDCILSSKQIVINDSANTPEELKWDQIFIYQLILLLRLPLNSQTISKLKVRLQELTRLWTITHLIYTLVFLKRTGDIIKPIDLYTDIVNGFYYLDNRISTKLISIFGYIIIRYPALFRPILRRIYKMVKGKDFNPGGSLRI